MEKFSALSQFFAARRFFPVGAAIALHLVIVLPLAARLNIWLDEAWTMKTTASGWLYAWREAVAAERQAPLYFAFLAWWRAIDDSLFFARLFSIVCITLTIALIPALLRRFAPGSSDWRNFLLMLVVALHPYSIWASLEARVYALVVLLSAALLVFWFDGYAAAKTSRKAQAFYILLAVVGLYTNYYLGFLLFAGACFLLWLKRWKTFGDYVWQMLLAGLFFAPLALIVERQFATNADYYREPTAFIPGVKLVWNTFNYFLLPSAESEIIALLRVWSARLAIVALLFLVVKNLRKISSPTIALGIFVAVSGGFLMTAYFVMGSDYVQLRHSAPLFIPLLLLLSAVLTNLTTDNRGFYIWFALLLIFVPTRLFSDYSPPIKNGDWNRIAEFIETNETDNQPITTFHLQDSLPLEFVYRGKNRILPAESIGDWRAQGAPLTDGRWQKQIEFLISQIPPNQTHLWLITDARCHNEKTAVECRPLEDFLEADYTIEKSADFHLRRVRLLRRK